MKIIRLQTIYNLHNDQLNRLCKINLKQKVSNIRTADGESYLIKGDGYYTMDSRRLLDVRLFPSDARIMLNTDNICSEICNMNTCIVAEVPLLPEGHVSYSFVVSLHGYEIDTDSPVPRTIEDNGLISKKYDACVMCIPIDAPGVYKRTDVPLHVTLWENPTIKYWIDLYGKQPQ